MATYIAVTLTFSNMICVKLPRVVFGLDGAPRLGARLAKDFRA